MSIISLERLAPEELVASSARAVTRRRLFRTTGSMALGAAMTTAFLGRPGPADAQCTSAAPCGPAPLCGCSRCNDGYNWQCDGAEAETDPALWGSGSQPCNPNYSNCWDSGSTHCCDCCAYFPTCRSGALCFNCGPGNWYKCICRQGVC